MRPQLARTVFALLLGISLAMFLTPGDDVPQGGPNDKVVHALIFVALAVAGRWAQVPWLRSASAWRRTPRSPRSCRPCCRSTATATCLDFLADAVGIGIGLLLSLVAMRLGARARPPRSRSL